MSKREEIRCTPEGECCVYEGTKKIRCLPKKLARKMMAQQERTRRARRAFDDTGIIKVPKYGKTTYMMLHPSTVIPDGWQVSLFDEQGPYGHVEGESRDKAIDEALESETLHDVTVVTEKAFTKLSHTKEFVEGTKRVEYIRLDNQLRYEGGWENEIVQQAWKESRNAPTFDKAIQILSAGLIKLRKLKK